MGAARYINLNESEDQELQSIENNKSLNNKLRLRAKILRLSNLGMPIAKLSKHLNRHSTTILRDFDRWESNGIKGLRDGISRGQPSPLGQKEKDFLIKKLQEERSWTASQLSEVLNETFKLKVNRETIRVCLHKLGYSWQRHRYIPVKEPESELLKEKQTEFNTLKKEQRTER